MLFSEPKIPQCEVSHAPRRRQKAFQCSSASRKFLNFAPQQPEGDTPVARFQCSSASRKFLNGRRTTRIARRLPSFSALQRAENSSMRDFNYDTDGADVVSVLFSEPKIPQLQSGVVGGTPRLAFQCSSASRKFLNPVAARAAAVRDEFQCSSASRKFLNSRCRSPQRAARMRFQCSSASRKFLNPDPRTCVHPYSRLRRSRFVVPEPSWCVAMTPVY